MTNLVALLSEWLFEIAALLGLTGGGGLAGYVRQVSRKADDADSRARKNERRLVGDPDDPNSEGVLTIAYQTRDELRQLRREMKEEHREVMDKLDDDEE